MNFKRLTNITFQLKYMYNIVILYVYLYIVNMYIQSCFKKLSHFAVLLVDKTYVKFHQYCAIVEY